ncbi:WecB/TagA/CpsF family glycosyltransferase [Glutamicibacter nicotianae]|uniref:WecB/TagA/CpsF family glycosyltransferase n=1 Tax=Glutamicibacter nicotianae TaxID=37929 RepID=UPI0013CEFD27|nr:WecB/TagA/CpsF family glycosyltransferase [Glutamicibacter nicotianae]
MSNTVPRVDLGGIVVDLHTSTSAVDTIIDHARSAQRSGPPSDRHSPAALSVVSANLDHIVQFGNDSRWQGALGDSLQPTVPLHLASEARAGQGQMDWLTLLDGAPLVAQARRVTGRSWPRLAGSDLIGPLLDAAEREGLSVGFLGGAPQVQAQLAQSLRDARPGLQVAGFWAPAREQLEDAEQSLRLAEQVRASDTDILVVGLGKPRQELWMASYGSLTGASVLLAFGAVVDFLAGTVTRSPRWVADNGLEWAWRLALEPRRLAQRYLVDDPPGLVRILRERELLDPEPRNTLSSEPDKSDALPGFPANPQPERFVPLEAPAAVSVLVVTYNNADSIEELIDSLRGEARSLALRVVVSDNGSADGTTELLRQHPDVLLLENRANLGYAGGINVARSLRGDCQAVLVLNPDMTVSPGAIGNMLARQRRSGAAVVVPRLLEPDGRTYQSLRREPSLSRALGDAVFGSKLPARPGWSTEIEFNTESYAHPHRVHWATGAAVLIDAAVEEQLGAWDEQFFLYSEETDYFRRARQLGDVWYEPSAVMTHQMGGSGTSLSLNALMAVNRVRYARKHHTASYASAYHATVALHHLARRRKPEHRGLFGTVAAESRWAALPSGTQSHDGGENFPHGVVIIPAHNEATVLARTLAPLAPLAAAGAIEVIVACNGCTDATAEVARGFDGVQVLESPIPSKVAALNLADAATQSYPRLYLDADIQVTPAALRMTFEYLRRPGAVAARPAFEYDTTGASTLVRAFYRARRRMPSTNSALWGAGAYALSEEGRARFAEFPALTADDLFVDLQFSDAEKQIVPSIPVKVATPRTLVSLLGILRRNYRGQDELVAPDAPGPRPKSTKGTATELLRSIGGPRTAADALAYASLVAWARLRNRKPATTAHVWERDNSSR